ncbi:MAG: GNAT family N-acetyltransferase [Pseudomonadota bacterium]
MSDGGAGADGPGLTVRPLAAGDEAEWRRLWTAYLTFYETSVSEAVYRTTWARLLSRGPGEYRGLLAHAPDPAGGEGPALGLAHYLFHRHCWHAADVVYLQDLYVDETARGAGAGRALIEAVYGAADDAGAANVYWLTQDFNAEARRLYDRIGSETPFIKYNRR